MPNSRILIKPCTHPDTPTPTHTRPKIGHTQPHPLRPSQKKVTLTYIYSLPAKRGHTYPHPLRSSQKNIMPTHTHQHSANKRSHSSIPSQKRVTNTHIHLHLPKKWSHPAKKGHIHPNIAERKNVTCLTHDVYVKIIPFSQY